MEINEKNRKRKLFDWYFKSNLLLRILIGLLLGAAAGIVFQEKILWIAPLGSVMVNLLKMIVMPLILSTIIVGTSSISPSTLGKAGVKIVLFYLFTSAVAVGVGLVTANVFKPGMGMALGTATQAAGRELTQPDLVQTLLAIIPKNPFGSMASGAVLPTIFFAIITGIALSYLKQSNKEIVKKSGEMVHLFFNGVAEVMHLVVKGVLQYVPIGVFALIAVVFGKQGAQAFGVLGKVTGTAFTAFLIQMLVVYSLLLLIVRVNPVDFFKKIRTPLVTAFVTRSSAGTLPVTMDTVDKKLGVSPNIYSFTLPLGATINMDGNAIYQGICTVFIGFAIGMPLDIGQQLTVMLTAVLASIGAAGIPGAGAIMLLMVLNSVGLTVEAGTPVAAAYAMILGIDAVLDMGRTALNVTGDIVGTLVVAKSEKLIRDVPAEEKADTAA